MYPQEGEDGKFHELHRGTMVARRNSGNVHIRRSSVLLRVQFGLCSRGAPFDRRVTPGCSACHCYMYQRTNGKLVVRTRPLFLMKFTR